MKGKPSRTNETTTTDARFSDTHSTYWLEVMGDPPVTFGVTEGHRLLVGTDRTCDVVLGDKTVSGRHCEVTCRDGLLWVKDLGSKNGVLTGGALVRQAQLQPGARLDLGRTTLRVRTTPPDDQAARELSLPDVVGTSPPMLRLYRQVYKLAPLPVPVLITGQTGTGKELIASALHQLGPRKGSPFVAVNSGGLRKDLAQSALFGHIRGAFTGANTHQEGAFVAANGGTLFLDEVGELAPDVQVQLLRTLELGTVTPLGTTQEIPVNVRVVSATWAPLDQWIRIGGFREDLYHRLAVTTLHVPPLSERTQDIIPLADRFLARLLPQVGPKRLSTGAQTALQEHSWHGNVRQLRNAITRAAIAADGPWIDASHVAEALADNSAAGPRRLSKEAAIDLVERHRGRVAAAARACGIPRSTFRGWLDG